MVRFFGRLSSRLVILIPSSMLLGLIAGLIWDLSALRGAILPLTMLMVYPMLVNFRPGEALSLKHGRAVGLAMGMNFIVMPLAAWLLATLFFGGEPGLFVGMVLIGLFPTSGMTISWTGFARGNVPAAVKMTVIGLLLAAVLAPFYLLALAGARVQVDLLGIAATVGLVVLVPMAAGSLTRTALVRKYGQKTYAARIKPVFPGISTLGVVAIVFLAIGLKAPMIASSPGLVLTIAVPLVLFYAVSFALTTVVGRLTLERGEAIAVVYGTVMRNLSIALGIAIASFGPMAALVLAAAFIVQVQSAAWYVRLADFLFGPAETVNSQGTEPSVKIPAGEAAPAG
ncbi:MAG: bile acid:sodium symporter [Thermoleophilia bacterium]